MLMQDLSDRSRSKPTRKTSNYTNGENPLMEDYEKTKSVERVETKNYEYYDKEFTPPPKNHKTTDEVQGEFKKMNPPPSLVK